ncbi:MAG: cell division protein FtsZ [Betaproteobacteria bacterium]|nr:cell division protein FtsZ [Betaproteobacteria bacterium]MDE2123631.1 cell division protein FtsZ [Betaproteobacteria bacterium]MDE2187469.1 cell division protein FtsZ [Betaproteobacteria bacterium]MDE2326052.1 cell division protein FtsZ [Betaproteobacteria bacterium]
MAFEMIEDAANNGFNSGTNIKVIGMGGGGGNAVEHMIASGVKGVEFICANTDAQALKSSSSHRFIQLGKTGLGAGGKPQVGRDAAEQAQASIRDALTGAHMLFITAGMGGGTGTGAAPVVARIAREMGILTVAVVTKPFEFEGTKRLSNADTGLEELEKNVDSLIVVLNEKLLEVYGDDISQKEAFAKANDVLKNATGGIAEIINVPGMINADFEDVKTVMGEPGKAMMGTAVSSGADRARLAAEQAVVCPLLDGVDLSGAKGVLVNITADDSLKLSETREAMNAIRAYAAPDAHIIFGTVNDPTMGDSLRVTVLATGLSKARVVVKAAPSLTVLRTGTDSGPMSMGHGSGPGIDTSQIPAIWRNPRGNAPSAHVNALMQSGMEELEIPAFLRKQAD